jgi:hypothetical protein
VLRARTATCLFIDGGAACGAPAVPGKSWCTHHHAVATRPPSRSEAALVRLSAPIGPREARPGPGASEEAAMSLTGRHGDGWAAPRRGWRYG